MAQLTPSTSVHPAKPLTPQDLEGDLIQSGHPLFGIIWVNRDRMSGAPCFAGTRVPVQSLFDHIEAGDTLQTFLDDFPEVTRDQAIAVLELSSSRLLGDLVPR
jgi:uncharacterized protein (DUF433 family)